MNKAYDATQEFKPFPNRGLGGQLIDDVKFPGHPNKRGYRRSAGKPNTSRHAPNRRVRVCKVSGSPYMGYTYERA